MPVYRYLLLMPSKMMVNRYKLQTPKMREMAEEMATGVQCQQDLGRQKACGARTSRDRMERAGMGAKEGGQSLAEAP